MDPVNLCNNLLHKLLVRVRIRDLRATDAFLGCAGSHSPQPFMAGV